MFTSRNEILNCVFQSRGFAFKIVGQVSGCPDTDDVGRQFIAEAVQALTMTELRKLHADPSRGLDLIADVAGDFTPDFHLKPVRHAVWRKLNRGRTRMDRLLAIYLPQFSKRGA
ncbi:hypothetical protein ATDW_36910 (plasmid) [Asticcacaulis sp. DW145]|uniref:hypothetical protein n=1 Tax=Asticcacaulis sp. DW145 TaxID=3095608 RepID=UPI0030896F26|nr:hypothetical protein ATDW_36910 [Asticcacaulis sp. DW145]